MTHVLPKLGIIAGAGALPLEIVRACQASGRACHVIAVAEFADAVAPSIEHTRISISKIGATIKRLKAVGCGDITFAGKFLRPDGREIKIRPDLGGLEFLARLLGGLWRSDDTLHRAAANMFQARGFRVVSPLEAAPNLAARKGCLTKREPEPSVALTFQQALKIAKQHGETKRGQAVVVEASVVIASETREGTDAMLRALGPGPRPHAVLVKAMAPNQLTTMDPPAIGESTVVHAAGAGLAGILVEAGRSVVVDEARVRAKADELGLFVCADTLETP